MIKESTLQTNQQIGAILRDERIARGLSCGEISRDCKLQEVFVRALEDGHTDYLPTHIYFRMFARLYADTLAIDSEQLLGKLYPELPLPEKPEFAGAASRAQARAEKQFDSAGAAISIESTPTLNSTLNPAGAAPMFKGQPDFDMTGLTSQASDSTSRGNKILTRGALALAGALTLFFIAKNTVLNNGFAEEKPNTIVVSDSQPIDSETNNNSQIPAYQPREQLTLTIKAKPSAKNAGVVVVADGDTLFNRKISSGESYTWSSDYRFKLDISDKNQVEIYIAGQRLHTPDGSDKRMSGFEITQLNYEEMLAPPMSSANNK